jgi:hypothetical protein
LETGVGARNINIKDLQDRLRSIGGVLERPREVASTGSDAWASNRSTKLTKT